MNIRSTSTVAEVVGEIDLANWEKILYTQCGASAIAYQALSTRDALAVFSEVGSIADPEAVGVFDVTVGDAPKVLRISFDAPILGQRIQGLQENGRRVTAV